ncbi:MAG TPA: prepilin-type N-terminal cleavage/methylation domain-containing protein, partial [Tepidisphaeraceae bacterium]|nr:prepilin-type N-terminal cleavage/methylation domain-containing protein [Tepidisphaeraceae bacterium]
MNAPAPPARPTPPERGSPRGFTLVEVLVAIGLLTVIMLGVSFVFRAVTGAVGTGQALSAAARDARSAHSVMYVDAKNALRDEDPFMVIASTRRAAYLHSDDVAADPDKRAATLDINADGATTADGEDLDAQPALINYRNCRTDILGLFVRNVHRKQTGSGTQIVSPMGTRDAFVWYGHVAQAGQVGGTTYYNPGDGDPVANEVNYYSADWVLGRVVMLLADEVIDQSNVRQWAIDSTGVNPIPLAAGSYASADPQKRPIQASRTDLVQMSTETLLDGIKGYQLQNANWWKGLVYRFQAVPQPNVPLNGDGAALSSPLFLSHCRSFTVEFGGDF